MKGPRIHVYKYRERLYVPELAVTDAGFYWEHGPVTDLASDAVALQPILEESLAKGNPMVKTPARDEYPRVPHVVRAAGARSVSAFEREATLWAIEAAEKELILLKLARDSKRGWSGPEEEYKFARTIEGMAALAAAVVQSP